MIDKEQCPRPERIVRRNHLHIALKLSFCRVILIHMGKRQSIVIDRNGEIGSRCQRFGELIVGASEELVLMLVRSFIHQDSAKLIVSDGQYFRPLGFFHHLPCRYFSRFPLPQPNGGLDDLTLACETSPAILFVSLLETLERRRPPMLVQIFHRLAI